MSKPDLELDYQIVKGVEVFLTVIVGNAQFGVTLAHLDGRKVAEGPQLITETLGKGESLAGTLLVVRTAVADVNPHTNRAIVSYQLTGGAVNVVEHSQKDAEEDGDIVPFKAVIHFKGGDGNENA